MLLDLFMHSICHSGLLYAFFFQGDGNFHQQQKSTAPNAFNNPSLLGNKGFWSNEDTFKEYIGSRGAAVEDDQRKVRP